jgi:hypothetical protein
VLVPVIRIGRVASQCGETTARGKIEKRFDDFQCRLPCLCEKYQVREFTDGNRLLAEAVAYDPSVGPGGPAAPARIVQPPLGAVPTRAAQQGAEYSPSCGSTVAGSIIGAVGPCLLVWFPNV